MQIRYFLICLLFLTACGGGGSSNPDTLSNTDTAENSNNSDITASNSWQAFSGEESGEPQGIGLAIERNGEDIYISYNTYTKRNLFRTQDGESFHAYYTNSTSAFVSFIDELGRIYLLGDYTDNEQFFTLNDGFPFGGFVNGNSSTLLVMGNSPKTGLFTGSKLERSKSRGDSWEYVDFDNNPDTTHKVLASEPAFNGIDTFIVTSIESGLWISNDLGDSWKNILTDKGVFDVVVGNALYPALFFAIHRGELLASTDTGDTWKRYDPPVDQKGEIAEWIDLELLDDGQLVAWGVPINSENGIAQVYISDNSGQSWSPVGDPIGQSKSAIGNVSIPNLEANSQYYFINYNGKFYKLKR